jgi:hypothetical protein
VERVKDIKATESYNLNLNLNLNLNEEFTSFLLGDLKSAERESKQDSFCPITMSKQLD